MTHQIDTSPRRPAAAAWTRRDDITDAVTTAAAVSVLAILGAALAPFADPVVRRVVAFTIEYSLPGLPGLLVLIAIAARREQHRSPETDTSEAAAEEEPPLGWPFNVAGRSRRSLFGVRLAGGILGAVAAWPTTTAITHDADETFSQVVGAVLAVLLVTLMSRWDERQERLRAQKS